MARFLLKYPMSRASETLEPHMSTKSEVPWVYLCLKVQYAWPQAGARLALGLPHAWPANGGQIDASEGGPPKGSAALALLESAVGSP